MRNWNEIGNDHRELIDSLNMEHNCTNVSVFNIHWRYYSCWATEHVFCFVAIIIRKIFRVRVIISHLWIKCGWVNFSNEKNEWKNLNGRKLKFSPIQTGSISLHPYLCLNFSDGTTLNSQLAQHHRKYEMSLSSMKPKCLAS